MCRVGVAVAAGSGHETQNRGLGEIAVSGEGTGGQARRKIREGENVLQVRRAQGQPAASRRVLLDCVGNPAFLRSQVRCKVDEAREELSFLESNPELFLRESLHRVGYSGALGNPLFPTKEALGRIDRGAIRNLFFENYTADRLVLAASGVNHQYLLDTAAPLLSDLPKGNPVHKPKSAYTGGDFRHKTDSETLMGGGASFSNGGPGKGLQSRLYIDGWRSFILQWWSRERIAVPALEVVNPL